MAKLKFIEVTGQKVLHDYNDRNKEIKDEIFYKKPSKKLIAVSDIKSIDRNTIQTTDANNRVILLNYLGSFEKISRLLSCGPKLCVY